MRAKSVKKSNNSAAKGGWLLCSPMPAKYGIHQRELIVEHIQKRLNGGYGLLKQDRQDKQESKNVRYT
jgi:hypothetical protein